MTRRRGTALQAEADALASAGRLPRRLRADAEDHEPEVHPLRDVGRGAAGDVREAVAEGRPLNDAQRHRHLGMVTPPPGAEL